MTQQTLLNGFLNLWNLIMAVGAALLVDRLGRRKLFLISTSIMLVSYIIITALSGSFANTGVPGVGTAVSTSKGFLMFSWLMYLATRLSLSCSSSLPATTSPSRLYSSRMSPRSGHLPSEPEGLPLSCSRPTPRCCLTSLSTLSRSTALHGSTILSLSASS